MNPLVDLNKEIEHKLQDGELVLAALLDRLETYLKIVDLTAENRALYLKYINHLFYYIECKRKLHLLNKIESKWATGLYNGKQPDYKLIDVARYQVAVIKIGKNDIRERLKQKNLPYKFLHPQNWNNLLNKKHDFLSRIQ